MNWDSWVLFPEVGTCSQTWEVRKPGVSSGAAPLWWHCFYLLKRLPVVLCSFLHLPRQQMQSFVLENESAQRRKAATLAWHRVASPLAFLVPTVVPRQAPLWWSCVSRLEGALFTHLNFFRTSIYFLPPHSPIQTTPLLRNVSVVTFPLSVADSFIQNLKDHVILSKQAGRGIQSFLHQKGQILGSQNTTCMFSLACKNYVCHQALRELANMF